LAPGIDYDYSGWTTDENEILKLKTEYPAAFKPGSETLTLRNKVQNFKGGNFIMTVPGLAIFIYLGVYLGYIPTTLIF